MFHKYQLIWHPIIKVYNYLLYFKINFYKPRFGKRIFENSSFDFNYKKSYLLGWLEIRVRRKSNG